VLACGPGADCCRLVAVLRWWPWSGPPSRKWWSSYTGSRGWPSPRRATRNSARYVERPGWWTRVPVSLLSCFFFSPYIRWKFVLNLDAGSDAWTWVCSKLLDYLFIYFNFDNSACQSLVIMQDNILVYLFFLSVFFFSNAFSKSGISSSFSLLSSPLYCLSHESFGRFGIFSQLMLFWDSPSEYVVFLFIFTLLTSGLLELFLHSTK